MISDVLHRMGTTFQVGSQQRSTNPWPQFKRACEAVRNGRVGNLQRIIIGLPGDPPGGDPTPQPVPATFDYDHWLGTTPMVPYTEDRCHPQNSLTDRGGWLRCEQFSAGMITGWGAHHLDIAHWGMGTEHTGPIQIEATAQFATGGLWNVHGAFRVEAKYANGVTLIVTGDAPNGIRFEGDEGWIFVTRGDARVTASDPANPNAQPPITASNARLLEPLPAGAIRLYGDENTEHHQDWLNAIRKRTAITAAPVEVSHRSTSACLISHIAMKLQRPLRWDPVQERFDDRQANAMIARPQRSAYRPATRVPGLADLLD
jgi:predicted dehydrogenase